MRLGTARVPGRVSGGRVRLIWVDNFWDGPLSGLAEFDASPVWFHFANEENEDDASWFRRFYLVRLSSTRLAEARARHAAFQRHVGTHCDYGEDGQRDLSQVRPGNDWSEFYDAYPPELVEDYGACEVVGWFEL